MLLFLVLIIRFFGFWLYICGAITYTISIGIASYRSNKNEEKRLMEIKKATYEKET